MTLEVDTDLDGFDAFFANVNPTAAAEEDAKKPKPDADDDGADASQDTPDGDAQDTPDADAQDTPDADAQDTPAADEDDEREVTVKQGDTEHKVKLKDLKATFAEREAVAKQTAEMTQARHQAAQGHQRAHTALTEMLKRAEAAFEPYSKLNMFALAKDPNVDAATLQQLQADAQAAYANVQYLKTELDANLQAAQGNAAAAQREASIAAIKVLTDPKTGIEGFGKQMWQDISDFAVKQGIPAQTIAALTDPAAIKLIHKAMLFDKQKAAADAAAAKVKTVKAQPTRTMKAATTADTTKAPKADAMRALRRSGSIEDATDAFAATFG